MRVSIEDKSQSDLILVAFWQAKAKDKRMWAKSNRIKQINGERMGSKRQRKRWRVGKRWKVSGVGRLTGRLHSSTAATIFITFDYVESQLYQFYSS